MCFFNLFFYLNSKIRWADDRGALSIGVLGYAFPLFLFIPYLALVIEKIIKKTISPLLIWISLIAAILGVYLFYKHKNRGEKIIDFYEHTKYNKWYYVVFLGIGMQVFVLALIHMLFSFINSII